MCAPAMDFADPVGERGLGCYHHVRARDATEPARVRFGYVYKDQAGRRSDFTRASWVADSQTYFCKKPRMEIDCSVFYIVTAIAKKIGG